MPRYQYLSAMCLNRSDSVSRWWNKARICMAACGSWQDRWYPIVYRSKQSSRPLVPRERFAVAHELAHAIVDDQLRLRPLRRSQYWALEGVCDDFAGRLLIPEKQFLAARAAMSGASSALSGIEALARTTNTSLIVAARAFWRDVLRLRHGVYFKRSVELELPTGSRGLRGRDATA